MRPLKTLSQPSWKRYLFAAALLLTSSLGMAVPESTDQQIQHADQIKLSNYDQFQILLKQLDAQGNQLNVLQRDWLAYLHAWQPQALAAFNTLLAQTRDTTVRARARTSLIYDQVNSSHYEDAFENASTLLDSLPEVEDRNAHFLILAAAADLYNSAGQYDLALGYIDQAHAYDSSDRSTCVAMDEKATTLGQSGKLRPGDPQIQAGLDACGRVNDTVGANIIRIALARAQLAQGDATNALKLLKDNIADVAATNSSALNSAFRSILAKAYLLAGDVTHAHDNAQSAIDYANKQEFSKSVADAYKVLYEIAKRQGDFQNALAAHRKYAAADKGYLNNASARSLAYQMVHQQVLDKKRQIDALSEQNKVLQLQQQVDAKSTETRRLYILLLLAGLALIAMWAWRTKRSQLKFQKLARRDGLTGISNRQHFFESAQDMPLATPRSSAWSRPARIV